MDLIIVESPTKAKTLSKFLGKEFVVQATMGHIKDLPKSKLGVDVEKNFAPDYLVVERQTVTIQDLKDAGKKATTVFLATDPDREGEAISAHVKEILTEDGVKDAQISRIEFHEITKNAVENALKTPRKVNENLVDAQIARRVLDRLVGYKLSPLLWKKVRRGLSAGRVQTVAVRLIVEKEREIQAFKPVEYWEIYCDLLTEAAKEIRVSLVKKESSALQVSNKKDADSVVSELKAARYLVSDVKRKVVRKKPYAPFTTSSLAQFGASNFSWSAKKTMSIAQKLYEGGFITYHRTDSVSLSKEAVSSLRDYIDETYGEKYLSPETRVYKTKSKSAQEAHEAIRPTDVQKETIDLAGKGSYNQDSKKLYGAIWKRFVACQMADTIYDETTIEVETNNRYLLRASGQIMKFDGWRKVVPLSATKDTPLLPDLEKGDPLNLKEVHADQKFTQPPAKFNEASLIKTLEKLGIGRPSTYAPTISTIIFRNYVEKDEGRFTPTPIGVAVNDFLIGNFSDVFEYGFTADMEDNLDRVAEGKLKWQSTISDFWKPFEGKISVVEEKAERVKIETEKLNKPCPDCAKDKELQEANKGELVIRIGRFGKFISCSRFPECKYTDKYQEKINMKCPDCKKGDVIVKKTKKGRVFFGCSRYPKCEFASWKNPSKIENQPSSE